MRYCVPVAWCLGAILAFSDLSLAVDHEWNVGRGKWHESSNWVSGTLPGSADAVFIENGGTPELEYYWDIGQLRVSGSGPYGAASSLDHLKHILTVNGDVEIGAGEGERGYYYLRDNEEDMYISLFVEGNFYLGSAPDANGEMHFYAPPGDVMFTHLHDISGSLYVGMNGGRGLYHIHAASGPSTRAMLSVHGDAFVGGTEDDPGIGVVYQETGWVDVMESMSKTLYIGGYPGSEGYYEVLHGELNARNTQVGAWTGNGSGTLIIHPEGSFFTSYLLVRYTGVFWSMRDWQTQRLQVTGGEAWFVDETGTNWYDLTLDYDEWNDANGVLGGNEGLLVAGRLIVAKDDRAFFTQVAGLASLGELVLAQEATGVGSYTLQYGELETTSDACVGAVGTGTFTQTYGQAFVGGTLRLAQEANSIGAYSISNGSLEAGAVVAGQGGSGTFTQSGGQIAIAGDLRAGQDANSTGTLTLSGGSLTARSVIVGQEDPGAGLDGTGTLGITSSSASLLVNQLLHLGANSTLNVSQSSTSLIIEPLDGAGTAGVEIAATDSNALAGLGNLTLRCQFDANDASLGKTIEVEVPGLACGSGLEAEEFSQANFLLDKLTVGRATEEPNACGVTIVLVDAADNHPGDPTDEGLYLRTLEFLPGGAIRLKHVGESTDRNLYYLRVPGEQTDNPRQFFPGDALLDGNVDGLDFLRWQANFNRWPSGGATWTNADFNGDRKVDGLDFLIWQVYFGRTTPSGQDGGGMSLRESVDTDDDGMISLEEARAAFGSGDGH